MGDLRAHAKRRTWDGCELLNGRDECNIVGLACHISTPLTTAEMTVRRLFWLLLFSFLDPCGSGWLLPTTDEKSWFARLYILARRSMSPLFRYLSFCGAAAREGRTRPGRNSDGQRREWQPRGAQGVACAAASPLRRHRNTADNKRPANNKGRC